MKRKNYLWAVLTMLFLAGCNDHDDTGRTNEGDDNDDNIEVEEMSLTLTLPGSTTTLDLTKPLNVAPGNVLHYEIKGNDPDVDRNSLAVSATMSEGEGWTATVDGTARNITVATTHATYSAKMTVTLKDNKDLNLSYTVPVQFAFDAAGTQAEPNLIPNAQTLQGLAVLVNAGESYEDKYFKVTQDIDLSGVCGKDLNDGEGIDWTPIGKQTDKDTFIAFEGTFDGDGHTISGLYIDGGTTKEYQALFGHTGTSATVKGFTLKGEVSGYLNIAGIAAVNEGTISGCTNSVDVLSTMETTDHAASAYISGGGITGYNLGGSITDCVNKGNVTGKANYSGGIAGYNYVGVITDCTNIGKVTSSAGFVGGIAGNSLSGARLEETDSSDDLALIAGCTNTGDVTSSAGDIGYVGGIAGNNRKCVLLGCANTGNIAGCGSTGGVMGRQAADVAIACYNTGSVTLVKSLGSGQPAGGIVGISSKVAGSSPTPIIACYSTGSVSAVAESIDPKLGGAIGDLSSGGYPTCYWDIPGSSLPGIGIDEQHGSTAHPVRVDGTTVQWAAGDNSALSVMNAAIDAWNNAQPAGAPKCNWKYEANTDPATQAKTPLVLVRTSAGD